MLSSLFLKFITVYVPLSCLYSFEQFSEYVKPPSNVSRTSKHLTCLMVHSHTSFCDSFYIVLGFKHSKIWMRHKLYISFSFNMFNNGYKSSRIRADVPIHFLDENQLVWGLFLWPCKSFLSATSVKIQNDQQNYLKWQNAKWQNCLILKIAEKIQNGHENKKCIKIGQTPKWVTQMRKKTRWPTYFKMTA